MADVFEMPPAACTRSKRPCEFYAMKNAKTQQKDHRRYFVTPKSMTLLYGSEFWIHLPHLVKEKIVFYTTVAKQREHMKKVCDEIESLPICPKYGFAMLTEEQLGQK